MGAHIISELNNTAHNGSVQKPPRGGTGNGKIRLILQILIWKKKKENSKMRGKGISSLHNLEIYSEVNKFLDKLCAAKKEYPYRNIPVPHMLFGQDGEGSFEVLSEEIAEILYQNKLIQFRSKKKLIYYTFFQDINIGILREKIREGTVISNVFYGVVSIDFKLSLNSISKEKLGKFLQFMEENEDHICFLLRVLNDDLEEAKYCMAGIQDMNFYVFSIPNISCYEMAEIIFDEIKKDGFRVSDDLFAVFVRMTEFLYNQKLSFDMRMIRQLVNRLENYHILMRGVTEMITAQEIIKFVNEELVIELNYKGISSRQKIGF